MYYSRIRILDASPDAITLALPGGAVVVSENLSPSDFVDVEIRKHRKTRSLSSNAYFHAIIGEIASATGMDRELIKQGIKEQYGAKMAYNGRLVCKPSHLMDSTEFSELIRGAEIEATDAGVDLRKVRDA